MSSRRSRLAGRGLWAARCSTGDECGRGCRSCRSVHLSEHVTCARVLASMHVGRTGSRPFAQKAWARAPTGSDAVGRPRLPFARLHRAPSILPSRKSSVSFVPFSSEALPAEGMSVANSSTLAEIELSAADYGGRVGGDTNSLRASLNYRLEPDRDGWVELGRKPLCTSLGIVRDRFSLSSSVAMVPKAVPYGATQAIS